jgi:hypothetical protein
MRKVAISTLMVAAVGLAFASKGGGGDNKKANTVHLKTNFTPIRTNGNFTLKAGPSFTGSVVTGTQTTREYVSFNTLVTYQKGNSFYILPYTYKINTAVYLKNSGSNLRLLDLRIDMHR